LQHLPSLPAVQWQDAAERFVDRPGHGLTAAEKQGVTGEILAILTHPDLAALFGPYGRAEVPLTGVVGDVVVGGLVDRLAVLPDRVLLADFKTNRSPPVRLDDTPVMYLRQMASYRAVLKAIYPERPVRCALIWTREARISLLPDKLLDGHEPGRPAEIA
jgi:ATP-dependent helicase/nuclease subunit A